VRCT